MPTPEIDITPPRFSVLVGRTSARRLFVLLLIADLAFIVLNLLHWYTPLASSDAFSLDYERGYAEIFEYVQEFWIVLLVADVARSRREPRLLLWSTLFTYLLMDDACAIHERLGRALAETLGFPTVAGLHPHDLGEVLVSGTVFAVLLASLAALYRSASPLFQSVSRGLLGFILVLGACGVGADMLHVIGQADWAQHMYFLIEDGGEMLVMSAIVAYTFALADGIRDPPPTPG